MIIKNKISGIVVVIVLSVLLTALCFGLAACDGGETMTVSLSASNNVYSHGEQTVLIAFASTEKDAYVFEKGISVSDVTVGGGLEGKKVVSVSYVDDSTISVTLSGTVSGTVGKEGLLGSVAVNGGISGKATGTAYLTVYKPQMTTEGTSYSNIGNKYSFSSTFKLPYGAFAEEYVDTEHISLPDANGTLEVSLTEEKNLKIRVNGFVRTGSAVYPTVRIAVEVTSFGKELYVYVGVAAIGQGGGYDLV